MKNQYPQPIYRRDYHQPDYWIDQVELNVQLNEDVTTVRSTLQVRRNVDVGVHQRPLVLNGSHLRLQRLRLDGHSLKEWDYVVDDETLKIFHPAERFELETVVMLHPESNTSLDGLYQSNGIFCTQCEAEGFRKITYFLDRPDIMARYSVTVEGDKIRYPVLLSNGNRVAGGESGEGRHWVRWEDPFPKPCYLFALVAGNLHCHAGEFVTVSGRRVRLEIWVEPQNADKCEYALQSLQQAMRWDEVHFGREYDLDVYMIVAVSDFNMGAMENKGLNIFNSKFVLSRPDTATDEDYEDIASVIAHEYFHNWTGNRVTCRDWFQLTLKEGLTVFRDQLFTADHTSAAEKRIKDVEKLRIMQFPEDAGPMAHPIRPESYIEMNNFYTMTVYEKGAEVIRMYYSLLGVERFRRGMDLYFARHDGQAVTCDDFRRAMMDASGVDLVQFERWYTQAGTPHLTVTDRFDVETNSYHLTIQQSCPTNAETYKPQHIPIAIGLLDATGKDLPLIQRDSTRYTIASPLQPHQTTQILELRTAEQTFTFSPVTTRPIPSVLRNFSAPVTLQMHRPHEELAFLLAHDSDPFNRWDAGQTLAQSLLLQLATAWQNKEELTLEPLFLNSIARVLTDTTLDSVLKSLALTLPEEKVLAQQMPVIDVDALHAARQFMRTTLAEKFAPQWLTIYATHREKQYRHDKQAIARRRLSNHALEYISLLQTPQAIELVIEQFKQADNMTDSYAALACLCNMAIPERDNALQTFYQRWKHDPLVIDKWFTVQALSTLPDTFERVLSLAQHTDFNLKNPNRLRSLVGKFCTRNQAHFHRADGAAYHFLVDIILKVDGMNPQVAARLVSAFNQWQKFDYPRKTQMQTQLERIAAHPPLSKDVYEVVNKSLGSV